MAMVRRIPRGVCWTGIPLLIRVRRHIRDDGGGCSSRYEGGDAWGKRPIASGIACRLPKLCAATPGEGGMSRLVVVVYPELRSAGEVLAALRQRHEKSLADLDEAIYVTRAESGDLE